MNIDSPQVQALKQRYRDSLKEKSLVVTEMLDQLGRVEDLLPIREELHKLAGSSGMYGYSDISETCREAIKSIDDGKESALPLYLNRLIGLIEQHI